MKKLAKIATSLYQEAGSYKIDKGIKALGNL